MQKHDMYKSLQGLAVGDAFGQRFFGANNLIIQMVIKEKNLPDAPWPYTDDTAMAIGIVHVLEKKGYIDQERLADIFADNYMREPYRSYGGGAQALLQQIYRGTHWQQASQSLFNGQGSYGNGAAMRIAPLGVYFAHNTEQLIIEAQKSAQVTHWHKEGQIGAIAVALASQWVYLHPEAKGQNLEIINYVLDNIEESETKTRIYKALEIDFITDIRQVVEILGNGSQVAAFDTVPFCLWCVAKHLGNYEQALWTTVSGLGDRDTTCAIVGGILGAGEIEIPKAWLGAAEKIEKCYFS